MNLCATLASSAAAWEDRSVLLGIDFPPDSTEWIFFVSALVILFGPLVLERFGLPGILGIILGGMLVGPHVLDWVARDGTVESLGNLGLLYLMFLAGLELDLDEFQANRSSALTFGALTFTMPFVLGIAIAGGFGYGAATAILYGSLWASHTLISYPIVQEHGLLRDRAVGVAAGGTVMTDTLALSVLAAVAGSTESDARPSVLILEIAIGLAILAAVCVFVLPRLTRWVFAGVGQHRGARFLWVLVGLTGAALIADRAGIEGIVGAFFAGLALNRLVPARSRLMEQVEFVGGVFLVPFFLLSTGMLIDPSKFTERRVLGIAALSLAAVVGGKLLAAVLTGRVLRLTRPEVGLLFGLSIAQAAATLAAVTIGVEIGLFGPDLLNASLIVVLVTVLISTIVTRSSAGRIEPPPVAAERLAETVLVPVGGQPEPGVVRLAARLAMAKGGRVLTGVVTPRAGAGELEHARATAQEAERLAAAVGAEAEAIIRVDSSAEAGLAAAVAEHDVSLVVLGWRRAAFAADVIFGGARADLLALADVPTLAVSADGGDFRRVVLALDDGDLASTRSGERELAIGVARVAAAAARGSVLVVAPTDEAAREVAARIDDGADAVGDPRSRREAVAAVAREHDLVLLPARGSTVLHGDAVAISSLPVGCAVGVPVRPHATAGLVIGTPVLVGGRAS